MRLDKWLWAARFFKTRGVAGAAIDGGKIKVNGTTAKPAKAIKPGDLLDIRAGDQSWEVEVRALNDQRRPAAEARMLYAETINSIAARARHVELMKLAPMPVGERKGRPTKKDRRQLATFHEE
ncbi:RNA-binding protein [Pollutimonas nitritireducens]|uniref:RNA-binding protein n=1 Tax=Pollutimonas nitritireducens TaxID=2045209 RepID=A0A2N4UF68_9BURK|nr:RNA-binding S4 domain-containing protein [Pollutimonas nitritireducens]PLC53657.1 RNA-binding protein [Pollutimonas nitritireducens]